MHIRFVRPLLLAFASAFVVLCMSATSFAAIGITVSFGPPPLPVYEQPICPGDGYLWTPGYWAWGADFDDYYWVPGTWILAPEVGFFWTPGYWGWGNGGYLWYDGYWGPQVGFYGGINYGFGFFGVGFEGGHWENGHFFYNRAVNNINVTEIHNVYNITINVHNESHVSYNGGQGGITTRPTAAEEAAEHDRHVGPVAEQLHHAEQARSDPQQRASANHGKPTIAATSRAGDFKSGGAVAAREAGGEYTRPANHGEAARGGNAGATPGHVRELPAAERPPAPNTGNAKADKKYQKQQDKLYQQQSQEREKIAQQQEKEDKKAAKQNDAARQQVEQRHQQQTQQLQQKHQQQQQEMQQRIQAEPRGGKPR